MPRSNEESKERDTIIVAVGDIIINREEPESIFAFTASTLREADITFGHLQQTFSERGSPNFGAGFPQRAHPRNATALKFAGFNVMSFAGNQALDYGYDGFFDTIKLVEQNGIQVIGVGRDIYEARRPAIFQKQGNRVAFLAYTTILPPGYRADFGKPGVAPLRAYTLYESVRPEQPGSPARILTFADPSDIKAMQEDIKKVSDSADIVVVAIHGGLLFQRGKIAMHQKEFAHSAIDAGADLILGSHCHTLKGIEIYRNKAIFYSLSNFAMELDLSMMFEKPTPAAREVMEIYNWTVEPGWAATYPFPVDSRKTIIAKCVIRDRKIRKVSALPVVIDQSSRPRLALEREKDFGDVVEHLQMICAEASFKTEFSIHGNEVIIFENQDLQGCKVEQ